MRRLVQQLGGVLLLAALAVPECIGPAVSQPHGRSHRRLRPRRLDRYRRARGGAEAQRADRPALRHPQPAGRERHDRHPGRVARQARRLHDLRRLHLGNRGGAADRQAPHLFGDRRFRAGRRHRTGAGGADGVEELQGQHAAGVHRRGARQSRQVHLRRRRRQPAAHHGRLDEQAPRPQRRAHSLSRRRAGRQRRDRRPSRHVLRRRRGRQSRDRRRLGEGAGGDR